MRRDGPGATPATPAFGPIVECLGYAVRERVHTERAEHSRYGVGPEIVERVAAAVTETDADLVAVDDDLHPGQLADLADALAPATVRDRRGVVTDALTADGPVAENRAEEWTLQVERRRLANERRTAADGHEHRVADLDRRRDRLDGAYDELAATARERATAGHGDAGARVVLTRALGADGEAWSVLTDAAPLAGPLAPGTPTTASVPVAAGTLAVTAVPPVLAGLPEWYRRAVPGAVAALERADAVVCTVASDTGVAGDLRSVTESPLVVWSRSGEAADGDRPAGVTIAHGTAAALRERVTEAVPTTRLSLWLPYGDDAHALVAWLHDHTHVVTVDYADGVTATVVALPAAATTVRRRAERVGGHVEEA